MNLIRFLDGFFAGVVLSENFKWPLPEHLVVRADNGKTAVANLKALPAAGWPPGWSMYRKESESQLPETSGLVRGAAYRLMSDVEAFSARLPSINWDQPIKVEYPGTEGYFCRICIAKQGLSQENVIKGAMSLGDAKAHIERTHRKATAK